MPLRRDCRQRVFHPLQEPVKNIEGSSPSTLLLGGRRIVALQPKLVHPMNERICEVVRRRVFPGYWSIGDETPVSGLKSHLFHSILSVQFCFFAKSCIQAFLSHTRVFALSMEMAPCHRDYIVYGYLHCNPVSGYYTSDVRRLRLSSSSCKSPSKPYSYSYYILSLHTDGYIVRPILEDTISTSFLELDCYAALKEAMSTILLSVDSIMKQI